jgi:hypothetical protein
VIDVSHGPHYIEQRSLRRSSGSFGRAKAGARSPTPAVRDRQPTHPQNARARRPHRFYNAADMKRAAFFLVVVLTIALAGCAGGRSGSPTSPSSPAQPSPGGPPAGGAASTTVRLTDGVAGAPMCDVTPTVGIRTMASSDEEGAAILWADRAGEYAVAFAGSAVTTRTTSMKIPGPATSVSLIPAAFDLAAFNEMFRPSQKLQRWTSPPPLVVITRVLQYEGNYANDPVVLSDQMPDADREGLVANLSDGFVALTDRQLGRFSSVVVESPAVGSRVNVMRTGAIVVARCKGLTAGSSYWGYGRWAAAPSGAVVGGNMMIDADFDGPASPYAQFRRCLRIHELGHALGYNHVTVRQSVMNAAARLEPNGWDLQAVHIAFLRPPGNTAPDNDPSPFSLNVRTGALVWSPPLF